MTSARRLGWMLLLWSLAAMASGVALAQDDEIKEGPVYQNRTLSEWVEDILMVETNLSLPAQDAVRQVGTNALPWLVKWVDCDYTNDNTVLAGHAAEAFGLLKDQAKPAIPGLIKLLNQTTNYLTAMCVTRALVYVGRDSAPGLYAYLTRTNAPCRFAVFDHLRTENYLVVWDDRQSDALFKSLLHDASLDLDERMIIESAQADRKANREKHLAAEKGKANQKASAGVGTNTPAK